MDFITRQRFLTIAIIILVLLNLFSLGAIWILQSGRGSSSLPLAHDRRGGEGNIVDFLSKELNLTEAQVEAFKTVRRDLDQGRRFLEHEILEARRELVEESFQPNPDSAKVEMLALKIGENQIQLEQLVFEHFVKMRSLCNPEQSEKFDSLIHEILHRSKPPDTPHPPRDGRRPHDRKNPPPPPDHRRPQQENNPFH